jgi:ABC-2 type transport system permease protein
MRKIWAIAYKDVYGTFTDRSLILIMLVTPVMLATIISLAFGSFSSGGSGLTDIPVAVVNMDEGAEGINYGDMIVNLLVPPAENGVANAATPDMSALGSCDVETNGTQGASFSGSLYDLTNAVLFDDANAARAAVDSSEYAAAVIIPAGFSKGISYSQQNPKIEPVAIEVYGDSSRTVTPTVIRSVIQGIVDQFLTGNITVAATIDTLVARAQSDPAFGIQFGGAFATGEFQPNFACAFTPVFNNIGLDQQTVTGQQVEFNPLVTFGSAQAAFFALFTAAGTASSILEERRNGTLQRMIVSPTSRLQILLGKLLAVFANVLLQITFLFFAFTIIGSLLSGEVKSIWGTNIPAIVALVLVMSLSAAGVGMVSAAIAKTAEQANIIGSVVGILMGILGGAFFSVGAIPIPIFDVITRLSIVRWGSEGFTKLSNNQTDIGTNLIFLLGIGAVLFAISLFAFNRRQDV